MITMMEEHSSHAEELKAEAEEGEFWDSVTGVPLIPQLVIQAREEEMKEFRKHEVYVKVLVKSMLGADRKEAHRSEMGRCEQRG